MPTGDMLPANGQICGHCGDEWTNLIVAVDDGTSGFNPGDLIGCSECGAVHRVEIDGIVFTGDVIGRLSNAEYRRLTRAR